MSKKEGREGWVDIGLRRQDVNVTKAGFPTAGYHGGKILWTKLVVDETRRGDHGEFHQPSCRIISSCRETRTAATDLCILRLKEFYVELQNGGKCRIAVRDIDGR